MLSRRQRTSASSRSLRLESMEPRRMMAGDAGSTLRTAEDVGAVDDTLAVVGRVNYQDRLDFYRFEINRPGDVQLTLGELGRNADLLLVDEAGKSIEQSRNGGRRDEVIEVNLDAGIYYFAVQTRAYWGTTYQVDIVAPQADPAAPLDEVEYFGGSREWNVNAVNAPEAWAAGYSGEGVLVAVIDTGVDLDHPDLAGSIYVNPGEIAGDGIDNDGNGYIDDVNGYDFAGRDADPNDVGGHGTHVAGTIAAANNGFGTTGVAPDATILPVRVLGDDGSGSSNAVAAGIRYAADLGADIINLSLGGGYSRAIDQAIDYARGLGTFIVAAAGNDSATLPSFPARFSATDSNVISVGAHDRNLRSAGFSNDVGQSGSVQIDAPGVGVFSTYVGGRYASLSGTSMASPHVAGVAALALSANPTLAAADLRSLLVGGSADRPSGSDAIGRLDAATTVAYASRGFTAPPVSADSISSSALAASEGIAVYRTSELGQSIIDAIAGASSSNPALSSEATVTADPRSSDSDTEAADSVLGKLAVADSLANPNMILSSTSPSDLEARDEWFAAVENGGDDSEGLWDSLLDWSPWSTVS